MFVVRLLFGLMIAAPAAGMAQSTPALPADTSPAKHTREEISQLYVDANGGDARAEFRLGQAFAEGNGVPRHFDLALKWYHKAADAGNADAENAIGVMYRTGSGVEASQHEAVTWYRKAALHGNGPATFNLAMAYHHGDGVDGDESMAYAWFTVARDLGMQSAADAVTKMELDLPRATINNGLRMVAEMYAKGTEIKRDDAASVRQSRKAAERGDADSQVKLASALLAGRGAPKDLGEARKWCTAAATQHSAVAEVCLGHIYRAGLGIEKNPKEAMKHLAVAAQENNLPAMRMLGEMYESGEAGKVQRVEAFLWYVRAAIVGDSDSRKAAAKIKGTMGAAEWSEAQKKVQQWGMDPEKVEAFLQAGDS
jgi:hypothetical protein